MGLGMVYSIVKSSIDMLQHLQVQLTFFLQFSFFEIIIEIF